jgi:hypothetical protein
VNEVRLEVGVDEEAEAGVVRSTFQGCVIDIDKRELEVVGGK